MARIAENTVIVDGQEYKPGDVIPDFKSIKCVDTREPRKYQGLSADVSVLNDVIAKYASGGASCFMSDTGEYYEYDRKEKTWKLITNITERGFDSEKAYGALKHMLKNVTVSDEKIQSAVTNYLTVNPVLPGATTEQAQQIEQNKTDVASLKEETGSLKEDLDDSNILYNNILQIKNTINMLNPNKLKTGKVIGSNGEVIDGLSTRSTSELINVNPSIKLRVTTELNQSLAQYDSTGNKLAYTDTFNSLNPIDLNEDTKYIRICVWNDTLPFMLYQSDKILSYTDYGKYSENVRELVYIYASDTEEEIYLKLYNACNKGNCDVYWEYGVYEFGTIFELIKTKYGKVTAYELPIGGNCRYFFNGSTIIGTGISSDSNVINNSSIFGSWRKAQSYELHDGIFIANHLVYCVHGEASSSPIPYRTKYHNLRMFHNTVTDDYDTEIGLRKCIGAGTGLHPNVEVSNCYFQTDHGKDIGWHGHNSDDKTTFYINIHNCYFSHGIATDNLSTNETAELIFNGNSAPIIPITNHNGVKGWKVFAWNNEKRSN